ncbi:MAG: D-alanyl-D-alanine-carboxypeptidase/endopeptidase AmpH, partial [Enterobacteriaceae bacterium]
MDMRLLQKGVFPLVFTLLCSEPLYAVNDMMQLPSLVVDSYAEQIYRNSGATGMALIAIDNNQVISRYYGETRPGNGIRPNGDSLIRIASITKVMTSQLLVRMEAAGLVKSSDPLNRYAPPGKRVPGSAKANPIRLYHLATHTSGLPREQPGRPPKTTVFTWPNEMQRWNWLSKSKLPLAPGTHAAYSNVAYDLLADALAVAGGKSYTSLFYKWISGPLGMKDTTYTPNSAQCARLMVGRNAGPCRSAVAAVGSGGVYSTPNDMQKWMQQFLADKHGRRGAVLSKEHKIYFTRNQLTSLKGMDVAGRADGLGLGWVYMAAREGQVKMMQKTGGAGGFITYMALVPEKNIGVFVVITRGESTRFRTMSDGVN